MRYLKVDVGLSKNTMAVMEKFWKIMNPQQRSHDCARTRGVGGRNCEYKKKYKSSEYAVLEGEFGFEG